LIMRYNNYASTKQKKSVVLEGTFTSVSGVSIVHEMGAYKSTRATASLFQSNATEWVFDFSSILFFPTKGSRLRFHCLFSFLFCLTHGPATQWYFCDGGDFGSCGRYCLHDGRTSHVVRIYYQWCDLWSWKRRHWGAIVCCRLSAWLLQRLVDLSQKAWQEWLLFSWDVQLRRM
jgi:hypothetical protein